DLLAPADLDPAWLEQHLAAVLAHDDGDDARRLLRIARLTGREVAVRWSWRARPGGHGRAARHQHRGDRREHRDLLHILLSPRLLMTAMPAVRPRLDHIDVDAAPGVARVALPHRRRRHALHLVGDRAG